MEIVSIPSALMPGRPGGGAQRSDGSADGWVGGQAHETGHHGADQAVCGGHGPQPPHPGHRLDRLRAGGLYRRDLPLSVQVRGWSKLRWPAGMHVDVVGSVSGSVCWKVSHGPSLTNIDLQKRLRRMLVLIGQYTQGLCGGRSVTDPL